MLSFSETFSLIRLAPLHWFSLLCFRRQKSDSAGHGHDNLNCKHQPNVCKFLLVLKVQILDTAFTSGVEKCRSKTFSILSKLGFALGSTPLFHHHFIIHPVLFILCLISVKSVTSLTISVTFIAIHLLSHWPIYVWAMHSVLWVIEFCWEKSKKFEAENRCRQCIKNVIKLCYYLSGSFSLLSGFNCLSDDRLPHSSWINGLSSHVRPFFTDSDRKRAAGSRGEWRWWWPSQPLCINGRVAGQWGAAQLLFIPFQGYRH